MLKALLDKDLNSWSLQVKFRKNENISSPGSLVPTRWRPCWPESIWLSSLAYFCCLTSFFCLLAPTTEPDSRIYKTVSNSPTLGLTHTQIPTRRTASKINFYGWMALPHNSHNNGDNGLKPGLFSFYRCRVDALQISMCQFTWYSPTLGSATGIHNLEKNDLSAFCKNTFMTLNLTRN